MRLHTESTGRGPALVLLHGWGVHSGIWMPLLPELTSRFRITMVDLPGHGHSAPSRDGFDLDAVVCAVSAVSPRGAAWLGWSLGGQVALAAALAGADISRLVLVATTPRFVTAPGWPCGVAAETLAGFAAGLAEDHHQALRNFLTLQLRGDRRVAVLRGKLRRALAQRGDPAAAALRSGLEILASTDLRDRLGEIRQPALVVAGERDRLTPSEAGRQLAASLPGGEFLLLPGAAHLPFLARPAEFVAVVSGFLLGEAVRA